MYSDGFDLEFAQNRYNLAKLGDGLDQSPTVMVGDNNNNKNSVKIGAYSNPVGLSLRPTSENTCRFYYNNKIYVQYFQNNSS